MIELDDTEIYELKRQAQWERMQIEEEEVERRETGIIMNEGTHEPMNP